jgi:hypothetical protein
MRGLTTGGLRTGRYAMIRYTTGETELYDLSVDPLELDSLNGPQYDELRQLLLDTWRHYADCSGSQCQVNLPAALQTGRAANREITVRQNQARHRYYQY